MAEASSKHHAISALYIGHHSSYIHKAAILPETRYHRLAQKIPPIHIHPTEKPNILDRRYNKIDASWMK